MDTSRPYRIPETDKYLSDSGLRRRNADVQVEVMRYWFYQKYDGPEELPYDSGEGGYQWIWGGPFDAEEELQSEFGGTVRDEVIEKLASELNDISTEWSGKPNEDDFLDDLDFSGTDPFSTLIASLEDIENTALIKAGVKEQKTLHKLLFANVIMALETFLGDLFLTTLGKNHKYLEDFVFKTPHFQNTQIKLSSIFERLSKVEGEVRAYVLAHNWHRLKESGMMYKRAFNIKFPDVPTVVASGIRDRHTIVHRNGKGEDGTEGLWSLKDIQALQAAVLGFAGLIDDQVKSLVYTSGVKEDPGSTDYSSLL